MSDQSSVHVTTVLPNPAPPSEETLSCLSTELRKIGKYTVSRNWRGETVLATEAVPGITYRDAGLLVAASPNLALRAVGLWAVGRTLRRGETIDIDVSQNGVSNCLCNLQLCLESQRCDPSFAMSYNGLGSVVSGEETVTLSDGRTLNQRQLFLEALRCDPNDFMMYAMLGASMVPEDTVVLHDGREVNRLQIFIEGLRVDVNNSAMHAILATTLAPGETLTLFDGRVLNKRQLLVEALRLQPSSAMLHGNLANTLSSGETVLFHDGRTLSARELLLEGVRHGAQDSAAHAHLALSLLPNETVTLHDGRTLGRWQLFVEALRFDPSDVFLRFHVRQIMPADAAWSRQHHSVLYGKETNVLFATLLLGLQRLEEAGVLALAHQAMLEDMLECWTWDDDVEDTTDDDPFGLI